MQATTEVDVVEPPGLPRFRVALFTVLFLYAAVRCASFALPLVLSVKAAAIPGIIASTVALQAWAALWAAGAVLHILAMRWDWAARATLWTFTIKGLVVAVSFVVSALVVGGSVPASFAGAVSYGAPVVMLWLVQWALAMRTTVVVQAIPVVEAGIVAEAARGRLREVTGEIPEVAHD